MKKLVNVLSFLTLLIISLNGFSGEKTNNAAFSKEERAYYYNDLIKHIDSIKNLNKKLDIIKLNEEWTICTPGIMSTCDLTYKSKTNPENSFILEFQSWEKTIDVLIYSGPNHFSHFNIKGFEQTKKEQIQKYEMAKKVFYKYLNL